MASTLLRKSKDLRRVCAIVVKSVHIDTLNVLIRAESTSVPTRDSSNVDVREQSTSAPTKFQDSTGCNCPFEHIFENLDYGISKVRYAGQTSSSERKSTFQEEMDLEKETCSFSQDEKVESGIKQRADEIARKFSSDAYKNAKPFSEIPGFPTLPILGGIHNFFPGGVLYGLTWREQKWLMQKKYGNIVKETPFPGFTRINIFDPDDAELIFRTEGKWPLRDSFFFMQKHFNILHNKGVHGLATAQEAEWHKLRQGVSKYIVPPQVIGEYCRGVQMVARDFVTRLGKVKDSEGLIENVIPHIKNFSFEAIALVCFNTRLGAFSDDRSNQENIDFIQSVDTILECSYLELKQIPLFRYYKTKTYRRYENAMQCTKRICLKHIAIARERHRAKIVAGEAGVEQEVYMGLITNLITNDNLSEEEVFIIMHDIFTGGVDTTSHMLSFVLYLLAKHPNYQEQVREEILGELKNKDLLDIEDVRALKLVRAFVKETLRLYAVAPANSRNLKQDLVLSGYLVPKGSVVLIHNDWISLNEGYVEDAEKFMPERWLRHATSKINHPFAYLPFGFGPRSCLGRRMAELEVYLAIIELLKKYKLSQTNEVIKIGEGIVNALVPPLKIRLTPR
ncbi:hypothetical protein CHS0354_040351 [Potamilus streckersoni]|uniref:Cytochrome P450 n=1 Tax=Potamilus streckersoni TaxID=2493646 RepID=A0AAE0S0Z8_9BIVA|nr:hypothetical protein CHS0354_040351 [Potamilus streckersoni]